MFYFLHLHTVLLRLITYTARHTFGTRLGASGIVSAFTICELMGQGDVAMTQRYINLSKCDLDNTMEKVWEQNKQNAKKIKENNYKSIPVKITKI